MIDTILKILDRCISLLQTRKENRKEIFNFVVQPLFVEFGELAENTYRIFREARILAMNNDISLACERISQKRDEFLLARRKFRELVKEAEAIDIDGLGPFCKEMESFFFTTTIVVQDSISHLGELRDLFDLVRQNKISVEYLIDDIDTATREMEVRYMKVSKNYARLRFELSIPKQYSIKQINTKAEKSEGEK